MNSSIVLRFIKALGSGVGSAVAGVGATLPTYGEDMPSGEEIMNQIITLSLFNSIGNVAGEIANIQKYRGSTKEAVSQSKAILSEANQNYQEGIKLQNAGNAAAAQGYFDRAARLIASLKQTLAEMDASGALIGQTKDLKTIGKLLDAVQIPAAQAKTGIGETGTIFAPGTQAGTEIVPTDSLDTGKTANAAGINVPSAIATPALDAKLGAGTMDAIKAEDAGRAMGTVQEADVETPVARMTRTDIDNMSTEQKEYAERIEAKHKNIINSLKNGDVIVLDEKTVYNVQKNADGTMMLIGPGVVNNILNGKMDYNTAQNIDSILSSHYTIQDQNGNIKYQASPQKTEEPYVELLEDELGYIMPNGETLYFDEISAAHREILLNAVGKSNSEAITEGEAIRGGAIRVKPGVGAEVSLETPPTPKQYNILKKYIERFRGNDFYVDLTIDGTPYGSFTYTGSEIDPYKIINDIRMKINEEKVATPNQQQTETRQQGSTISLREMQPVAELSGAEFEKSDTPITETVGEYYESIGNHATNPILGEVVLDKRGIKSSIAHGLGRKKAMTFAAVPEVIENGKIIDHQENWKGRGYDTYVIAAPVNIAGERHYVGVVVTKSKTENNYYLHEVIDEKGDAAPIKTRSIAEASPSDALSPSIVSLLQNETNVNMPDGIKTEPAQAPGYNGNSPSPFGESAVGSNENIPLNPQDVNMQGEAAPQEPGTRREGVFYGEGIKRADAEADEILSGLKTFSPSIKEIKSRYTKDLTRNMDAAAGEDSQLRQVLAEAFEAPFYQSKSAFAH